jgi:hypothetical protein
MMIDTTVNDKNYTRQGGAVTEIGGTLNINTGGLQTVESGGILNIASGGKLEIGGVDVTAGAGGSNVAGVAAGYKIARGQATTSTASDTVVTGLTTVVAAFAQLDAGPVVGAEEATASIGDQAGTPAAGSILIQTWKTLGGTPATATTTSLKVNWVAIGT